MMNEYNMTASSIIDRKDLSINSWSSIRKSGFSLVEDKGVRVIHLPTGTISEADRERSQHANLGKAIKKLEDTLNTTSCVPISAQ